MHPNITADPDLSLIIPAFNESQIIERNVDELRVWLSKNMPDVSYQIVVINDGSTDGMGPMIDAYAARNEDTLAVHHKRNMGRGRSIRTGFEHTSGAAVICLDADLSYDPDHIPALLGPLQDGSSDITLASAYAPGGTVENVPFFRAWLSKWGNKVLSASFKGQFATVTCVVRGYTREALDSLELISDGKDLHLEILQKALLTNLKIVEVPARLKWRDRDRGKKQNKGLLASFLLFSMSGTTASHIVYNWLLRPGLVLFVPMASLAIIALIGSGLLAFNFLALFFNGSDIIEAFSLYQALRDTLVNGNLTLVIVFVSVTIFFIFVVFYFISQQNRKIFEENYILLSRINARLKKLDEK